MAEENSNSNASSGWGDWGWVSSTVNNVVSSATSLGKALVNTDEEEQPSESTQSNATEEAAAAAGESAPETSDAGTQSTQSSALSTASMMSFLNNIIQEVKNADEVKFMKTVATDIAQNTAVATKKLYSEGHTIIEKGVDALEAVGKTATKALDLEAWNRPISVTSNVGNASKAAFAELFREYNGQNSTQILASFAAECANKMEALLSSAADQVTPEQLKELKAIVDALEATLQFDQFILENAKTENYSPLTKYEHAAKIVTLSAEGHAKAKQMLRSFSEISERPTSSSELLSNANVMIEKAKIEAFVLYAKLASMAIEEMLNAARFMASKAEATAEEEDEEKEQQPLRLLPDSWRVPVKAVSAAEAEAPAEGSDAAAAAETQTTEQTEESDADDSYHEVANTLRLYVFLTMKEMFALCTAFTETIQQVVALTKSKTLRDEDEDALKNLNRELNHKSQTSVTELSELGNTAFVHVMDSLKNTATVLKYVAITIG